MTQISCGIPLQGGRDILRKPFFSDCLSISRSIECIRDSSRNFMGFLVCHPGQTSVADNRGLL